MLQETEQKEELQLQNIDELYGYYPQKPHWTCYSTSIQILASACTNCGSQQFSSSNTVQTFKFCHCQDCGQRYVERIHFGFLFKRF